MEAVEYVRHANASQPVAVDGIVQLGGHQRPRTRTPTRGANVGMALMRAQIAAVEANGRCGGVMKLMVLHTYGTKCNDAATCI